MNPPLKSVAEVFQTLGNPSKVCSAEHKRRLGGLMRGRRELMEANDASARIEVPHLLKNYKFRFLNLNKAHPTYERVLVAYS
jgi:hypothetical protein